MSKGRIIGLLLVVVVAGLAAWPTSRTFLQGRLENNVGYLYAQGVIVGRDPAAAARWYAAAADHGSPDGQFNYAYALQTGAGVTADWTQARTWYERAARQGHPQAANNLGILYANPPEGAPDLVRARAWLKRAAARADRLLAQTLAEDLKLMERDMQPAEIAASDALVATLVQ